jgi:hypothetical protein
MRSGGCLCGGIRYENHPAPDPGLHLSLYGLPAHRRQCLRVKLMRLKVDFGDHTHSILVGMKKERQNPKTEIEGKQALFVVNLEPRKIAGEVSEGMVFDIGYSDKVIPVLALPEKPVPNGTRAG